MTLSRKTELQRSSMKCTVAVKEPKRRVRKCATCREKFEPRNMTHKCCSGPCAESLVEKAKVAKVRKERQAGLIALKPVKWWKAKAKKVMHLFVRTRDEGKPCASCDTILLSWAASVVTTMPAICARWEALSTLNLMSATYGVNANFVMTDCMGTSGNTSADCE